MAREPQLMIATGMKKVGKTFTTTHAINSYVKSNPQTKRKGRKVLIYDVNMEYTQYKAIAIEDVKRFTHQSRPEVRRVLPYKGDGTIADVDSMIDILNAILYNFAGGLLVLEDINKYMIDTRTKEIIGTMATNRHRDLDIICHLQSLAPMTTRMWQNTSVIRFHYQMDSIDRYKQRIPNFEMYKIAQILVNQQRKRGDGYFFCYVSNEDVKITGKFSKRSFVNAVKEFLNLKPSTLNAAAKRFGGGAEGRAKAEAHYVDDLMKYYGNGR